MAREEVDKMRQQEPDLHHNYSLSSSDSLHISPVTTKNNKLTEVNHYAGISRENSMIMY